MENIELTVLIPTYNRRDALLRTLKSLQEQKNSNFYVVISDNCSLYSVQDLVKNDLDPIFTERVSVIRQPYNVGGTHNITGLLGLCHTQWGWLLGDDDFVQDDAIDKCLSVIDDYPQIDAFWFTINDSVTDDYILESMDDLLQSLKSNCERGDFIFCSNKVYNISKIGSFMDMTYRYSYTRITQCFPLMEILKSGKKVGLIGSKKIVKHSGFDDGSPTWDINKTVSGMRTLMDYPTGLCWKKHVEFVKLVMFPPNFVLSSYLKANSLPWNYKVYLKEIYNDCYSVYFPCYRRVFLKVAYHFASTKVGFNVMRKIFLIKKSYFSKKRGKIE